MISRYPFCRAQGPTSCPGVVILAVAFPGRHLDQRLSRKPAVGLSGKLQEDSGTIIAHHPAGGQRTTSRRQLTSPPGGVPCVRF
jgi:hypothetical protein